MRALGINRGVGPTEAAPGTASSARRAPTAEPRWHNHPILAAILGLLVFALPFVASVVAAWAMSRVLDRPAGVPQHLLWWAGVLSASLCALLIFDRAARRLLPLAALLKLSLIFPDRAPSRMGVALRSGSTKRLEAREIEALRRGDQEPAEAAHTILTLASSLNTHDRNTRGHSERVRAYADLIAAEMGLDPDDRDRLRWAALLHDLGKLTVSPTTLNSHEALSPDDWESLRRHPLEGARLAQPLSAWLGPWALAIEQHHERYDGTGYPFGLSGESLSLGARIVAVADSYDAMTSPRPYSPGMSAAAARRELASKAGTHFDPVVVRAFMSVALGRVRWVMGPLAFLSVAPFLPVFGGVRRSVEMAGRTVALSTASLVATVAVVPSPPEPPSAVSQPPPVVAGGVPETRSSGTASLSSEEETETVVTETVTEAVTEEGVTTETVTGGVMDAAPGRESSAHEPPVAEPLPFPTARAPGPSPESTATESDPPTTEGAPPVTDPDSSPPPADTAEEAPPPTTEAPAGCRANGKSVDNKRPCLPPRWGHTEDGNPNPTTTTTLG